MTDRIEHIGNSTIQHGSLNDRIYLLKFDPGDTQVLLARFKDLSEKNRYSKIFAKIPGPSEKAFLADGFVREAVIPSFYPEGDCVFMGKFLSAERERCRNRDEIDHIVSIANQKAGAGLKTTTETPVLSIRELLRDDMEELAEVYRTVFARYPFPIFDPEYLIGTMGSQAVYFGCFLDTKLVAASSAEVDWDKGRAEMTDFATLEEYRGKQLALRLLLHMEREMRPRGIEKAYTIARAISCGMNVTFSKAGYTFGGTLINNTHIADGIESMNVWYKTLI